MFLTPEEMSTHIYGEITDAITRDNRNHVVQAINTAIAEATGKLQPRYDVAAIFAATGSARNPILLSYIKDIAVWHIMALCSVNLEYEFRETRYKFAKTWLKEVQNGSDNPGLPEPAPQADGQKPGTGILFNSNRKRRDSF